MAEPSALGIDLGTTFSVVAQVNEAGLPVVLPNAEGSPTTPSVVLFDGGQAVVGAVARESLATEPESAVQLVKRHIGSGWTFDYRGVSFRPEHISALILRKLVAGCATAGRTDHRRPPSPCPPTSTTRCARRPCGRASWPAWTYSGCCPSPPPPRSPSATTSGQPERTGVVVDLGGGTFDVTVMEFSGNALTVRATGGDAYLGGANFDKVLFDYFVERFQAAHGLDINDPDALSLEECTQVSQDWLLRATRAKHDLTSRDRTTAALQAGGLTLRVELRREDFLARSRILLDEMTEKMLDVVPRPGLPRATSRWCSRLADQPGSRPCAPGCRTSSASPRTPRSARMRP